MVDIPAPSFTDKGFVPPSEADDILPAVLETMNEAFGGGMNVALDTPQGQIASSMTAAIGNANDAFCALANGVDPAYASGRLQDGIARIYFIERLPSRPTAVTATLIGAEGAVIPIGSRAVAVDGNEYISTVAATIPASGTIDVPFECVTSGPIPCPAGALNRIFTVVPGWDTINNAGAGVLGRDTETRAEFEERRRLSVAHNAQGSLPSVLGAVLSVDDVLDAFVTENVNATTDVVGGVSLAPKSLYVAAVGGDPDDVARAIWSKKAPGCSYNGNTTVVVYDENPSYNPPYPAYSVSYTVPSSLPIAFAVELADNGQVPADAAAQIQAAIISAFSGADGGPRARIGDTIYASRFYCPIAALGSWAQIVALKIGSQNAPEVQFTGSISGNALTVSGTGGGGTVAIGQSVMGNGVLAGTVITGGAGASWTVSKAQTVTSTTLYGVLAEDDLVVARIDQAPTISADDVAVTLT